MNLEEIKKALAEGKRVFWKHKGYEVIKDNIGQYLVAFRQGLKDENYWGLTWMDGVTLNGKEEDFFFSYQ